MSTGMKGFLLLLIAGLCAGFLAAATAAPEPYTLLGRSGAPPVEVGLDQAQRAWLRERQELRLGTSAPDYPPFDLSTSGRDYEGMTADYAAIIAQATGLP